jgi:hypothetical protein
MGIFVLEAGNPHITIWNWKTGAVLVVGYLFLYEVDM